MDYVDMLDLLKEGKKMSRGDWGYDAYIYMQDYDLWICFMASGNKRYYDVELSDMLSDNWMIYNNPA